MREERGMLILNCCEAVEVAERFADGLASQQEWEAAPTGERVLWEFLAAVQNKLEKRGRAGSVSKSGASR